MRLISFFILCFLWQNILADDDRSMERLTLPEETPTAPLFKPPQQRFALIIGNAQYQNLTPLKNTIHDAEDMAKKLKKLGFKVILETDANQARINTAIEQFFQQLKNAEDNAVGLFYYSGHGVENNNINYLLPVGEVISNVNHLESRAIRLDKILKGFSQFKQNKSNYFVILDACRNNPLGKNGWGKPQNNYSIKNISWLFGAGYGQRASDNSANRNGLFSTALLKQLGTKGATAEQIFKAVTATVNKQSNEKQVPVMGGSPTQDFMFYPGKRVKMDVIIDNEISTQWLILIISTIGLLIAIAVYYFYQHQKTAWASELNPNDFYIKSAEAQQAITQSKLIDHEVKGYLKDMNSKKVVGVIPATYPITLGRNKDNNIVIERNEISGQHLNIGWDKKTQSFWIQDLNSSNGSWWDKDQAILPKKQPLEEKQSFYLADQYSHYAIIKSLTQSN